MSKIIVITGITGKQGGSVANVFLRYPAWEVRAITRDPTKPSAQHWAEKGVKLIQADQDDLESLKKAFVGAHAIFAMTDFWNPMYDPKSAIEAQEQGITINEFCYNLESKRGKNMAIAANTALSTLERFVYSSLSNSRRLSGGKYRQNWHFDSKARVVDFIRYDPNMTELSTRTSFLEVGLYIDNWKLSGVLKEIMRDEKDGTFYHQGIGDGNAKMPFIWTQRDTGVLVKALVDNSPEKTMLGYSEWLTWREFMKIWCETLGLQLSSNAHRSITAEELRNSVTFNPVKDQVTEGLLCGQEFGWHGGNPEVIHPAELGIEKSLTPVTEYIRQEDWTPIIGT
ncbi:hypothetical protein BGZ60DRAFT_375037 [Tricladium varicosporioides]|nr:hypothetical protein BGZ60DRAFT_375037 [Hymenoscyphus varicosporioides]